MPPWLQDIESLESVSRDEETRRLLLRMAQLSREGRLDGFLLALAGDPDLDEATKGIFAELAEDPSFLLAVEEYLGRTRVQH
jgi:hypothetical protein